MKTLIASALLISTSALAHDSQFSSNSCDVDLNAGMRINKELIEFSKNDKPLYQILNDQTLVVSGQTIALNAQQQSLVTEYSTNVRALLPQIQTLAVDAIDLAVEGVNLAFNELLGEGNDVSSSLSDELHQIRDEVNLQFAQDKEFSIDEHGTLGGDFFTSDFEERIEAVVEETVQNSMGSLLIAVGQEMLFSGGNMDAFEARMENFGEQIEHEMESRAEELEQRAQSLCHSVYQIDALESQLQQEIEEMADFDVITADIKDRSKA